MLALKPDDRPTAAELLDEPMFAMALKAGALPSGALAHMNKTMDMDMINDKIEQSSAYPQHVLRKESPDSTMEHL